MDDEDRYTRMTLRIPKELHGQLSEEADRTSKSLNAEIVERLSRSFHGDDTTKLMRSNTVLLRAMADFVMLRHHHPEAMAAMEEPILRMAKAVKETPNDAEVMQNANLGLVDYIRALTDALEQVTQQLGPGWANRQDAVEGAADARDPAPPTLAFPVKGSGRTIQVEVRKKRPPLAFPKPKPKS